MIAGENVLGLVLAGGQSRRMGAAKSSVLLAGKPLIMHVLGRLAPQCAKLIVSDNDGATAALHGLEIVADLNAERLGPLAGIEAGLKALNAPLEWLLTTPVDTPFLPNDLAFRLHQACMAEGRSCALAWSGANAHPTVALWHKSLLEDLTEQLHGHDLRRVRLFAERHHAARVDWPVDEGDPFFNINTPKDLGEAERRIGS